MASQDTELAVTSAALQELAWTGPFVVKPMSSRQATGMICRSQTPPGQEIPKHASSKEGKCKREARGAEGKGQREGRGARIGRNRSPPRASSRCLPPLPLPSSCQNPDSLNPTAATKPSPTNASAPFHCRSCQRGNHPSSDRVDTGHGALRAWNRLLAWTHLAHRRPRQRPPSHAFLCCFARLRGIAGGIQFGVTLVARQ